MAAFVACSRDSQDSPEPKDNESLGSGGSEQGGAGSVAGHSTGGSEAAGGGEASGGVGGACADSLPVLDVAPEKISELGLYSEIETKTLSPVVQMFEPRFKLWSDGAVKKRWLYLPECGAPIDTSNMDEWDFPIGTYAFKEFVVDGVLVETRVIHRNGPAETDWLYATYVWNDEKTEAELDNDGRFVPRAGNSAPYTVPSVAGGDCVRCHGPNLKEAEAPRFGLPSRILGANAVDLSHSGPGLTMESLSAGGHLSDAPLMPFVMPGTTIEQDAVGYLHANCGYCHNDTAQGQELDTDYFLRLKSTDRTLDEMGAYITAVNQPVTLSYHGQGGPPCSHRIHGGDVAMSCIHERMGLRSVLQMPPLATNISDPDGLQKIVDWIAVLPAPN